MMHDCITAPLLIPACAGAAQGRLGLAAYIGVCTVIIAPVLAPWTGEIDD
jgi:hypothetical protein